MAQVRAAERFGRLCHVFIVGQPVHRRTLLCSYCTLAVTTLVAISQYTEIHCLTPRSAEEDDSFRLLGDVHCRCKGRAPAGCMYARKTGRFQVQPTPVCWPSSSLLSLSFFFVLPEPRIRNRQRLGFATNRAGRAASPRVNYRILR